MMVLIAWCKTGFYVGLYVGKQDGKWTGKTQASKKKETSSFVFRNPSQQEKKVITFLLVNQIFFSVAVFLEQCSAVVDNDTGRTGFFINLVKSAFSIKCVSLNLPSYYPIYWQHFLELIEV